MTFEEVLNRGERLVYTNVGFSMAPLIREGRDVLIIEKCDTSALKKYDIVLFKRQNIKGRGEYVLHRIVKILPDNSLFIAGDNCCEGERVEPEMILGVLTGLNRKGKPFDFDGLGYRLYVRLWCAPYRFRFFLLKLKSFIKRMARAAAYRLKKRK